MVLEDSQTQRTFQRAEGESVSSTPFYSVELNILLAYANRGP